MIFVDLFVNVFIKVFEWYVIIVNINFGVYVELN